MQFCGVTAAISMGAIAERGRLLPAMVFTFVWATIVYCPLACWVWNVNGWAANYGVMDFAGGGPVEIGSGMTALAYAWVLGRRHDRMMINFRPHNVSLILLGTVLLWFGWLGFNGGSVFGANIRAAMTCWNTNLTASFAAAAWVLLDWRLARKWSMVGWCSGTISGLVAATPASGFLTPWASVILGVVTGIVCNYATKGEFPAYISSITRRLTRQQSSTGSALMIRWMSSRNTVSPASSVSSSTRCSDPTLSLAWTASTLDWRTPRRAPSRVVG